MNIKLFKKPLTLALVVIAAAMFLTACSKDKSTNSQNSGGDNNNPPPPTNLIRISNFSFSPQQLTISVGDTVTWQNNDSVNHTITSDSGNMMHSPMMARNQSYQVVFTETGTFPYHCSVHPSMTGTIIVQGN